MKKEDFSKSKQKDCNHNWVSLDIEGKTRQCSFCGKYKIKDKIKNKVVN